MVPLAFTVLLIVGCVAAAIAYRVGLLSGHALLSAERRERNKAIDRGNRFSQRAADLYGELANARHDAEAERIVTAALQLRVREQDRQLDAARELGLVANLD